MVGGASLTGSLVSAVGVIGALVAVWVLIRDRPAPPASLPVRLTVWVFGTYFGVLALTTALNGPDSMRHIEYLIIAPFLYFIPLMLVLDRSDAVPSLRLVSRVALIGAVPTALLAFWFSFVMGVYRPELAPQNQNVLAGILVMQAMLALSGWSEVSRRERIIAVFSCLVIFAAVVFSVQTRGAIFAGAMMTLVSAVFFGLRLPGVGRWVTGALIIVFLAVGADAMWPMAEGLFIRLSAPDFADWSHSTGQRLTMYKAGVEVFFDHPWLGVGMHQRFAATLPYYFGEVPDWLYFTHLHNMALTHAVAGGVPAVLAVLAVLVLPAALGLSLRDLPASLRWLGLMLTTGLFTLGLTETVLFHDLNTTFHMFNTVLYALLCAKAQRA